MSHYLPGAHWATKDGTRNIVIETEAAEFRERQFLIRNLATNRKTLIGITGLSRKFRFVGYATTGET